MTPPLFPTGTFTPRPGPGSPLRMLAAQSATELRLALRHGEQVLLTVLIPIVLLVGLTLLSVVPLPEPRIAAVAPGVLALAVMSTAFTGQAIALGFDRRYGVVRRLAATALPRWLLVAGRLVAVLGVVAVQVIVLGAIACPVNAVDITARASTPGATAATRGSGSGTTTNIVSPTSRTTGISSVSSTCSPWRRARRSSVPDWAASIRSGAPGPGRGVKVPAGNSGRLTSAAPAR